MPLNWRHQNTALLPSCEIFATQTLHNVTCLFLHKTVGRDFICFLKNKLTWRLLDPKRQQTHPSITGIFGICQTDTDTPAHCLHFLSSCGVWIWKGRLQQNLDEIQIVCEWEPARNSSYSLNACHGNNTITTHKTIPPLKLLHIIQGSDSLTKITLY